MKYQYIMDPWSKAKDGKEEKQKEKRKRLKVGDGARKPPGPIQNWC